MKIKVNHLGIALYDNKPTLPANRWFEPNAEREDHTSRFKLEMNFLGHFEPVKLRSSLYWPPRDLRRLKFWQEHKDQYEEWLQRAFHIQAEARAGRIRTSLPALIGIPSKNLKLKTGKGAHFTWQVPVIPSLIIAVQEQTATERFWNISWISPTEERVFVLNATDMATEVENKKHSPTSTRISKAYPQFGEIESGLFMDLVQTKVGKAVDEDYLNFKRQVMELIGSGTELSRLQVNHMCAQHKDWEERLLKEI